MKTQVEMLQDRIESILNDELKLRPVHPWKNDSAWVIAHYSGPGRAWVNQRGKDGKIILFKDKKAAVAYLKGGA